MRETSLYVFSPPQAPPTSQVTLQSPRKHTAHGMRFDWVCTPDSPKAATMGASKSGRGITGMTFTARNGPGVQGSGASSPLCPRPGFCVGAGGRCGWELIAGRRERVPGAWPSVGRQGDPDLWGSGGPGIAGLVVLRENPLPKFYVGPAPRSLRLGQAPLLGHYRPWASPTRTLTSGC